ncbi:MAG: ribosome silencing factor [Planctomycetes bacterium]|nr:ribosome silencing factor [Planctomycetota bacterium]
MDALELAIACARVAEDRKGRDIKIIEVAEIMPLMDYFVLITGMNPRHIKGMTQELSKVIKDFYKEKPSVEGADAGWWVLLDAGSVVIHLFEEKARAFYEMDELWADAREVDWKQ